MGARKSYVGSTIGLSTEPSAKFTTVERVSTSSGVCVVEECMCEEQSPAKKAKSS